MPHVPTEQLPLLAGIALGGVVLMVAALPLLRDPATVAALELQPSASAPAPPPAANNGTASPVVANASGSASARHASAADAKPPVPFDEDGKDTAGLLDAKLADAELAAATSVEQLTRLAKQHPSDERVFTKLARAQAAAPGGGAAALATLKTLFAGSPKSRDDKELQAIVLRSANGKPDVQGPALELMSTGMGSVGPDLLYDLTTAPSVAKAAKQKALDLTKREDVRKLASPALLVALDLRDHPGCGRKDYFAQAEKVGDKRSLGYLTPLVATKGCGFFLDPSDCFACLGNREELNRAIAAIKAR